MTAFAGFGPAAPLDLSDVSPRAVDGIVGRIVDGTMPAFTAAAASVRHCARPVRLVGSSMTVDAATGEVLSEIASADQPLGVLWRPCGNRRAEVCPACSRLYARDTFEVIRTGVAGGKGVPASVSAAPLVFATLTAPSFGHVHGARDGKPCRTGARVCPHGQPTWCRQTHNPEDPVVGSPLCRWCYDWASAVVWQWWAPELWRRFTIALRRALARRLGVSQTRLRDVASVQFAKVAEYQARGTVHFHALIRVDGPTGPGSSSPVDGTVLADLVRTAVARTSYDAAPVDEADVPRTLRFGRQFDVRLVRSGIETDTLTGEAVAGYLAKYATKSVTTGAGTRAHLTQMRDWCLMLAERAAISCRTTGPDPDDDGCTCGRCADSPYRLLRRWAHMLGFRGHFATKSRAYSVTLTALRRARTRFMRLRARGDQIDTADLEARLMADDTETTLVVGSWSFAGAGWMHEGDVALALAAAARAREYAQWRAQHHR